ncbi:MAG: hypothetical protein PHQ95_02585 [Candidatus Gracilibacteria bacterium]|nr:hypothetical protein [Candidatus Gracilibacteria bacterium]
MQNKSGFSTIIAILITAFLTVLGAGMLNLFITENSMSHFLSDGISAYMSAEGALEYTLLKSSNHREGFSDTITDSDAESSLLQNPLSEIKKTTISSTLRASDTSYTGSIIPGSFDIIPLFYDAGERIQDSSKNPNKNTSDIIKTIDFVVTQNGDINWNIIGNDTNGKTYGISGIGSSTKSFGNISSAVITQGVSKQMDTNIMIANTKSIQNFLNTYDNNYLILSNISSTPIQYHITSSNGFALPVRSISTSSTVGKSKQNIDFNENRSRLFDILKYSIFNK